MSRPSPKQVIQVGSQQVALPAGVSAIDWALERVNYQNPRIRAFLGCLRVLDGILESNYALLHCSPEHLLDIWAKVRHVVELIRERIAPLLQIPSRIPSLEEARQHAQAAVEMLDRYVLREIDRYPEKVPEDHLLEVRKLLCVAIGQLHAFLQDTFGEILAKDPRSTHDKDYFLSRRFPKDIEEAEYLHVTLDRMRIYLDKLELIRKQHLTDPAAQMRREETLPSRHGWRGTKFFLEILLNGLTPKLKEVLPLRGVRFYEMELLDRYSTEIPTRCRLALEMHETGCETFDAMRADASGSRQEREQNVRDLMASHAALSRRIATMLGDIDKLLQDLVAFVPLWLEAVEKRRALLLKRSAGSRDGSKGEDPEDALDD